MDRGAWQEPDTWVAHSPLIMVLAPRATSPTRQQTSEARTKVLQPAERTPQTQKARQNEITKKYVAAKGAR